MENSKVLEKALDIVSALASGEDVGKTGANAVLYSDYTSDGDVYDMVNVILKKLNIDIYEYNYSLYITAGDNNKVFGYSNDELKKELGIKLNKELYLCYFIMYNIITRFYNDSASFTYVEYIKSEEIIAAVDSSLSDIITRLKVLSLDEVEEHSFKEIALLWEDMPRVNSEDTIFRASRTSKAGIVKLVTNFMTAQGLLAESEGRYYPKDRMKAMTENYFDTHKSRLYEIFAK